MIEKHPDNLQAVADAMTGYEDRCEEILLLLGGKRSLSPSERADVEHRYRALKEALKAVAKHGTVSGARRLQTDTEVAFFHPAVKEALIELKPATHTHPITSHWASAVDNAQTVLRDYRPDL